MRELIRKIDMTQVNENQFRHRYAGCIVLTQDHKILLQQRDENAHTFAGCLATFGGRIEAGETPLAGLIRELHEELGADLKKEDVIFLGTITESALDHQDLIYTYFWHDQHATITGCYEGKAQYYTSIDTALKHPKVMEDVRCLLAECQKQTLLKSMKA